MKPSIVSLGSYADLDSTEPSVSGSKCSVGLSSPWLVVRNTRKDLQVFKRATDSTKLNVDVWVVALKSINKYVDSSTESLKAPLCNFSGLAD